MEKNREADRTSLQTAYVSCVEEYVMDRESFCGNTGESSTKPGPATSWPVYGLVDLQA